MVHYIFWQLGEECWSRVDVYWVVTWTALKMLKGKADLEFLIRIQVFKKLKYDLDFLLFYRYYNKPFKKQFLSHLLRWNVKKAQLCLTAHSYFRLHGCLETILRLAARNEIVLNSHYIFLKNLPNKCINFKTAFILMFLSVSQIAFRTIVPRVTSQNRKRRSLWLFINSFCTYW